jgi:16S rRNA (adenine1518-N6/adenine1519-N6)-dimethyltransferase
LRKIPSLDYNDFTMERLGQHFMKSKTALEAIVRAIEPNAGETIIEIGPGAGALTEPLAEACARSRAHLVAFEKDEVLAKELTDRFRGKGVEIVAADILEALPERLRHNGVAKITGNIPYYVTGRLLRIIGNAPQKPARVVITIQEEVAERIIAEPPRMNLLAASIAVWASAKIIQRLAPEAFSPPPNVRSATIVLEARELPHTPHNLSEYYRTVKAVFKQPRKTVFNNLRDGAKIAPETARAILAELGVAPNERPQSLSVEMLIKLASLL